MAKDLACRGAENGSESKAGEPKSWFTALSRRSVFFRSSTILRLGIWSPTPGLSVSARQWPWVTSVLGVRKHPRQERLDAMKKGQAECRVALLCKGAVNRMVSC